MVVQRLYSGNVIINDYVVLAVKCRDIPMVVRRLYSGNVIVNDYVVPEVKCTIGISLHFTARTT
jgi:hypothetical protein